MWPAVLLALSLIGSARGDDGKCEESYLTKLEVQRKSAVRLSGYETQLFAFNATNRPGEDSLSLVMHMTVDRRGKLREWCKGWKGPISVSVYIRPQDQEDEVLAKVTDPGCVRRHADIHIVRPKSDSLANATDMYTHYPFNVMRNAALDGATTKYVFLLDADFRLRPVGKVTHDEVFPWAKEIMRKTAAGDPTPAMYIVPAFETVKPSLPVPETTEELFEALSMQRCTLFYGHYCVPCHHPTNSLKWRNTPPMSEAYEAIFQDGFEPYVIVERDILPAYDERFVGRGWDKMSFFYELHTSGVRFLVLPPPVFLIHSGRGDLPKDGEYTAEYMRRQDENKAHWNQFKVECLRRHGREVAEKEQQEAADAEKTLQEINAPPPPPAPPAEENAGGEDLWRADQLPPIHPDSFSSASLSENSVCIANRDSSQQAVLGALEWVCSQDHPAVNCTNIRYFPSRLMERADWAFDRWYQAHRSEQGEEACDFGGSGRIVECDPSPKRCAVRSGATDEEIQSGLEWV
eukprot:Sspe_Gene.30935::Locus_15286_Transcript_2_2_Confidence_0.750_Length_1602::g.30935::m.30935/K09668/LARGE; glycosyltransferase-like protein LARGE